MVVPSTCCRAKSTTNTVSECPCSQRATCTCGEKPAGHCICDKAPAENTITGPRCSCRLRPAGQCTCDRREEENQIVEKAEHGEVPACECGKRPRDSCTCERNGGLYPGEVDFTTKKL